MHSVSYSRRAKISHKEILRSRLHPPPQPCIQPWRDPRFANRATLNCQDQGTRVMPITRSTACIRYIPRRYRGGKAEHCIIRSGHSAKRPCFSLSVVCRFNEPNVRDPRLLFSHPCLCNYFVCWLRLISRLAIQFEVCDPGGRGEFGLLHRNT